MSRTPLEFIVGGVAVGIFLGLVLFSVIGPTIQIETVDATNDMIEVQRLHINQLSKDKERLQAEVELAKPEDHTISILTVIFIIFILFFLLALHAIFSYRETKHEELNAKEEIELWERKHEEAMKEIRLLKEKQTRRIKK